MSPPTTYQNPDEFLSYKLPDLPVPISIGNLRLNVSYFGPVYFFHPSYSYHRHYSAHLIQRLHCAQQYRHKTDIPTIEIQQNIQQISKVQS